MGPDAVTTSLWRAKLSGIVRRHRTNPTSTGARPMSQIFSRDRASRPIPAADVHAVLARHMLADGFEIVLDLDRSEGSYLVDAVTGRRYLDFFTFFASNPVGMNHPKINNEEFIRRLGRVALHKPSSSDLYTVEMAEFVDTFFRVAVPDHFTYVFLIEGGALAVENALKVAFDWKVRKNFAKGYDREVGHKVLHFRHAFHGRTGYTMSLTNTDPTKTDLFPKFNDWPRVLNPAARFPLSGENLERTLEAERASIAQIMAALETFKDEIACLILEPIQAEGGDNHFRVEYLRELRRICDEHEMLLIFDEVQTGIGLTGSMWAHQTLGVTPDIISFGKKTQVCGILVGERVDEVPENVFHVSSRINSTKYLEIIEEENLVDNARLMGAYLKERLEELEREFPSTITNARGLGLMCAFDLPSTHERDTLRKECYERGMMVLSAGDRSIRFRPALNVTREHIDEAAAIIRASLGEMREGHVPKAVEELELPKDE
jgi:L-lysine 6-transaminase